MTCEVCSRLHAHNQPCPLRIARAYTMQPQALENTTEPDKRWMASHPDFSVVDTVEEAVADLCNYDD